jgi:putative RecB family exonuclease
MPIYSHSRLSTFENCPRQYWYRYLAKVKVERFDTVEAFLGSRVHDSLEELYARLLNGRLMTRDDLLDLYDGLWKKEWHDDIRIVARKYRKADYHHVGRSALTAYYTRYQPFDQSQTLALETPIHLDLDGTGKYRMIGYVDRLSQAPGVGAYEVHDYKTAKSLPTQADVDDDRQLALYHLGVQAKWNGVKQVDLIWHYVRFDKEIRSRRTLAQLAAVKTQCIHLIDDIESRDADEESFKTCPSRLCDWCEYASICPAMKHRVAVQQMPAKELKADDGVKLVDKLASLAAQRKKLAQKNAQLAQEQEALLEDLVELASKLGVESVSGRTHHVDIVTRTRLEYPTAKDPQRARFEQALRRAGLWEQVVTFNWQAFRSIWNKLPAKAKVNLSKFVVEEQTTQAKLKKGGANKT